MGYVTFTMIGLSFEGFNFADKFNKNCGIYLQMDFIMIKTMLNLKLEKRGYNTQACYKSLEMTKKTIDFFKDMNISVE